MINILVVDDEVMICNTIKRALRVDGLLVSFVLSVKEAIDMMEKQIFNLIITDIKMPEIDGIAFMKIIKRDRPEIPILAISGFATGKMAKEVSMNGAYGFLEKPFAIEDLLSKVRKGIDLT